MEAAARQLGAKFEAARLLLEAAPACGADAKAMQAAAAELGALEVRFALSTSHLYLLAAGGEAGRQRAAAEFGRVLAAEDFARGVDLLARRGLAACLAAGALLRDTPALLGGAARPDACGPDKKADRKADRKADKKSALGCVPNGCRGGEDRAARQQAVAAAQRILDTYPGASASTAGGPGGAGVAADYDVCPACGQGMAVDAADSGLRCPDPACAVVRKLDGTVFDDAQLHNQEGQKSKSGTFNPNRHFQFWMQHILAREPEDEIGDRGDPDNLYGEKTLAAVRRIVARDGLLLRLLTVNDMRAILRELGLTVLNKNVPLLLKKVTGVGPPAIPDALLVRVENLFTKAIEIAEGVRAAPRDGPFGQTERVNRNYYPYYIYRIIEALTAEADEARRVLYYIYIQSKDTVEADDANWEQICKELAEITYQPTDRSLGARYAPT